MRRYLIAALFLAACSNATTDEGGWRRRVGVIHPEFSSIQMLVIPSEVQVGRAFDVIVRTFGSSSCTRALELKAEVSAARLDLTPYAEYAPAHAVCTEDLHAFDHSARVTLHTVGPATVRVHGRNERGEAVTYSMQITVRP